MSTSPDVTRPLRIAMVAPLWASIPPVSYGGAELIVHLLTEELVRCGHEVTLFASGDSRTSARLHPVCPRHVLAAMARGEAYEYEPYANSGLAEAVRQQDQFDVIHSHLGLAQLPMCALARTPVLCTLHIPPDLDEKWVLARHPDIPVVAISQYQANGVPARRVATRVVYHGIDFGTFRWSSGPGRYLAFLGRMGPQKSPATAIQIAQAVGMPLVLAGAPQAEDEEAYFAAEVKPLIDGTSVVHIGPVNHSGKTELLRDAAALLFPIQGGEAFGIAMVEAMACGTPVIGWDLASVPEVVDTGKTGFYGDSVERLAALVPMAMALDRREVRRHAETRFSHRRMASDYIQLYREIIANGRAMGGWQVTEKPG